MSTGITSVKLPSSLKTVGYAVFYNNSITEVTVPSNIETIGLIAFSKNKISKVTLNEGLKSLGNEAFRYNELTTVTIPSTVTSIGTNAFTNNSLKTILSCFFTFPWILLFCRNHELNQKFGKSTHLIHPIYQSMTGLFIYMGFNSVTIILFIKYRKHSISSNIRWPAIIISDSKQ